MLAVVFLHCASYPRLHALPRCLSAIVLVGNGLYCAALVGIFNFRLLAVWCGETPERLAHLMSG